jgi:hypothetical protein
MKKQREHEAYLVRSGARIRESVRCLPKGHFQQIRQMFDQQTSSSTSKLTTIDERHPVKSVPSHVLMKLSVTDDEKLHHTNTSLAERQSLDGINRDYLAEYQAFRMKMNNEVIEHQTVYPLKSNASYVQQTTSTRGKASVWKK